MITDALISIALFVADLIIGILPSGGTLPASVHSAAASLGGYLAVFDPLVPVGTLISALTLVFSVEIGIFAFRSARWIISHLPFIGGK